MNVIRTEISFTKNVLNYHLPKREYYHFLMFISKSCRNIMHKVSGILKVIKKMSKKRKILCVANKKRIIVKPRENKYVDKKRKKLIEKINTVNLKLKINFGKNMVQFWNVVAVQKLFYVHFQQDLRDEFITSQPKSEYPNIKIIKVKDL